jgi:hypothetical protein
MVISVDFASKLDDGKKADKIKAELRLFQIKLMELVIIPLWDNL